MSSMSSMPKLTPANHFLHRHLSKGRWATVCTRCLKFAHIPIYLQKVDFCRCSSPGRTEGPYMRPDLYQFFEVSICDPIEILRKEGIEISGLHEYCGKATPWTQPDGGGHKVPLDDDDDDEPDPSAGDCLDPHLEDDNPLYDDVYDDVEPTTTTTTTAGGGNYANMGHHVEDSEDSDVSPDTGG